MATLSLPLWEGENICLCSIFLHSAGHLQYQNCRWQNGKDLTWYAKSSGSDLARAQLEEERRRARELDSQLIDEAMGIKPKKTRYIEGQPESHELKQMLSKVVYEYLPVL